MTTIGINIDIGKYSFHLIGPNVACGSIVTVSATSDLCPELGVNRTKSARKPTSILPPHGSLTATGPRCHALGRLGPPEATARRGTGAAGRDLGLGES